MTREQIGKRLREFRVKRGFTQKALAKLAGVDFTYVGKVERGEQFPSIKVLLKLAGSLNIPLDRFFIDDATCRLVCITPTDVLPALQAERLWELLRQMEESPEEDIYLLSEILRVLKKQREVKLGKEENIGMVAEKLKGYRKKKTKKK